MNTKIKEIFETGKVLGESGKVHKLHSSIDREEGEFLFRIIRDDATILKTLEVGCAFGISSLFICSALQGRNGVLHTIIDPFQTTQWDSVGIRNLEEAGFNFYKLIEIKSEFALPKILERNEGQYDFIFIDGWHTFDHTLLELFYSTRLLRVGGYLAIDDVGLSSVRRAINFLTNYPCYEIIGSVDYELKISWKKYLIRILMYPVPRKIFVDILSNSLYRRIFDDRLLRMVVLKKVAEDNRNWDWHNDAF